MSTSATKERLFEVIGKIDKTFKPKLNEFYNSSTNNPQMARRFNTNNGWIAWYDDSGEYHYINAKDYGGNYQEAMKQWGISGFQQDNNISVAGSNGPMREEDEVAPENLAVSPVGGVEEGALNEASSISPIHNYVYFAYNFPSDFIKKAWAEEPNMVQHLENKFSGFYKQYGAKGVMNTFYTELDSENQKILEDWIMANYHG